MLYDLQRQGRKVKADPELNLAMGAKGNIKGFYKYVNSKRKTRENAGNWAWNLLNWSGELVTRNMGKSKVLKAFFALVFKIKTSLHESQAPDTRGEVWSKED